MLELGPGTERDIGTRPDAIEICAERLDQLG